MLVDSKSSESSESESSADQKQLKRSLGHEGWTPSTGPSGFGFPAEAAIGGSLAFGPSASFAVSEPIAAAGSPIAVAGPAVAGPAFGPGFLAGSAGAPIGVSGPVAVSGPIAVSGPASGPGLYTEANLLDSGAYGSGYAPTYAR